MYLYLSSGRQQKILVFLNKKLRRGYKRNLRKEIIRHNRIYNDESDTNSEELVWTKIKIQFPKEYL